MLWGYLGELELGEHPPLLPPEQILGGGITEWVLRERKARRQAERRAAEAARKAPVTGLLAAIETGRDAAALRVSAVARLLGLVAEAGADVAAGRGAGAIGRLSASERDRRDLEDILIFIMASDAP